MKIETFDRFINQFVARYGPAKMNPETAEMWWKRLKTMIDYEFVAVTEELLGSRERTFGWKLVIEKRDLMFPASDKNKILEKQWANDPALAKDADKRKLLFGFMDRLMVKIKKREVTHEQWLNQMADEFLKVFGVQECQSITKSFMDGIFVEFHHAIHTKIRQQATARK